MQTIDFTQYHKWLHAVKNPTPDDERMAVNLVVGCLAIVCGSPTTDVRAWLARKPERAMLRRPRRAIHSPRGWKAIRELLSLASAVCEADRAFRVPDIGPLPVRESKPKKLSPEQSRRMHEAKRQKQQNLAALRTQRLKHRPVRKSQQAE